MTGKSGEARLSLYVVRRLTRFASVVASQSVPLLIRRRFGYEMQRVHCGTERNPVLEVTRSRIARSMVGRNQTGQCLQLRILVTD